MMAQTQGLVAMPPSPPGPPLSQRCFCRCRRALEDTPQTLTTGSRSEEARAAAAGEEMEDLH